jgi:hypothetical protein
MVAALVQQLFGWQPEAEIDEPPVGHRIALVDSTIAQRTFPQ